MTHQHLKRPKWIRLAKGMKARVIPNTEAGGGNSLNRCPVKGTNPKGIVIPEDGRVKIIAGPVEDLEHGLRYWQVKWGRRKGWTAACNDEEYWLEEVDD